MCVHAELSPENEPTGTLRVPVGAQLLWREGSAVPPINTEGPSPQENVSRFDEDTETKGVIH